MKKSSKRHNSSFNHSCRPNKLRRKSYKCRYCSRVSTCSVILSHEPRCRFRFERANMVQQQGEAVREAKLRESRYWKVKNEIRKKGLNMETKLGLRSFDGSVRMAALGPVVQQSRTIRRMLNLSILGSEVDAHSTARDTALVISFCHNFDYNFNFKARFPNRNWWNETPFFNNMVFGLACTSHYLGIDRLLQHCLSLIVQEMPGHPTFQGVRQMFAFDFYENLSPEEDAVIDMLLARYDALMH